MEVPEGPLRIAAKVGLSFLGVEGEEARYRPFSLFSVEHVALGVPLRRQDSGNGVPRQGEDMDDKRGNLSRRYT